MLSGFYLVLSRTIALERQIDQIPERTAAPAEQHTSRQDLVVVPIEEVVRRLGRLEQLANIILSKGEKGFQEIDKRIDLSYGRIDAFLQFSSEPALWHHLRSLEKPGIVDASRRLNDLRYLKQVLEEEEQAASQINRIS